MQLMQRPDRSIAIDCLRAVAIIWVIEYHFVPSPLFKYGTYGVLLFFIISGYCITRSAETSKTGWHFYAKRLGRLWPALFVCGFLTTAFKHLAPELTEPDRLLTWANYLTTMVALPTLSFLRLDNRFPDGAYWSLVVEFQFYAIYFALMAIGLRRHVLLIVCVFVAFRTITSEANQIGSNDFFTFFIAGMSVAALVEGRSREAAIGLAIAFLLDLYQLRFHFSQPSAPIAPSRTLLLWAGTAAMYAAAAYDLPKWAERLLLPLSFIGLISYPLYLIHQDVGNMILNWANVPRSTHGTALVIRSLGVPGLLAFIAWLVYRFVERNTIKPLTAVLSGSYRWKDRGVASTPDDTEMLIAMESGGHGLAREEQPSRSAEA
jgi:peptidoglycan/LPS O-acetylase OafA/YrhL